MPFFMNLAHLRPFQYSTQAMVAIGSGLCSTEPTHGEVEAGGEDRADQGIGKRLEGAEHVRQDTGHEAHSVSRDDSKTYTRLSPANETKTSR